MTNPNQMCEVLLFVCSKMVDETNISSKLPVADSTREFCGRKLCWWCLSPVFPLRTFLFGFADSFCFVFASTPSYEASPLCLILCNLFPRFFWYVKKQGKRKIQGVPQSQTAALSRHEEEEKTDKTKQAQIEQKYVKH